MLAVEVLIKKREKHTLSKEEIDFFVHGYTQGKIPDYQMASFLMAGYLNGFTTEETFLLTDSIIRSGKTLDFSDCDFPVVDKHSTGGIGDKTSLILAPIVASLGIGVPMIAGRGLGHTGGTIDKLEAIPGFSGDLSLEKFKSMIKEHRLSFVAQTNEICPADKKIYALRDVTATVESIPLICASIMSKKLAEGISSLVLDVKFGSGAFMKDFSQAKKLALSLQNIGKTFKKNVTAFLTNMEQPLGQFIGNSLEIEECLAILRNDPVAKTQFADTRELSLTLSAEMIRLSGMANSFDKAYEKALRSLESGSAYEKFDQICSLQGGQLKKLPKPSKTLELYADTGGFIGHIDSREIGFAGIVLGAGRNKTTDIINPVSGIQIHKKIGDFIQKGDLLWTLSSNTKDFFEEAKTRLHRCMTFSDSPVLSEPLIKEKIL